MSFPAHDLVELLITIVGRHDGVLHAGMTQVAVRLIGARSTTKLLGLSREPTLFGGSRPMRCITVAALVFALLVARPTDAQQVLVGTRKNRGVEPIVAEISPARIEATIRKLASFGTRHSLSDPDNPNRGIGAAGRWIKAELVSR
jgi:hypothetical protein